VDHQETAAGRAGEAGRRAAIGVVLLRIPLLAGPGAISTVMTTSIQASQARANR
jgi:small neutral amino acid transporter SnatA (MarC family)